MARVALLTGGAAGIGLATSRVLGEIPMRRAGEPEEVAQAVLFRATDLSSHAIRTMIEVAGGRHM